MRHLKGKAKKKRIAYTHGGEPNMMGWKIRVRHTIEV
jgi:hypothetical protein